MGAFLHGTVCMPLCQGLNRVIKCWGPETQRLAPPASVTCVLLGVLEYDALMLSCHFSLVQLKSAQWRQSSQTLKSAAIWALEISCIFSIYTVILMARRLAKAGDINLIELHGKYNLNCDFL